MLANKDFSQLFLMCQCWHISTSNSYSISITFILALAALPAPPKNRRPGWPTSVPSRTRRIFAVDCFFPQLINSVYLSQSHVLILSPHKVLLPLSSIDLWKFFYSSQFIRENCDIDSLVDIFKRTQLCGTLDNGDS